MAIQINLSEETGKGKGKGKGSTRKVDSLAGKGSTADKLKEDRKKKKKRLDEIMKVFGTGSGQ